MVSYWQGNNGNIGAFNDEGILACYEQVKTAILHKNLPSWRRLEILAGSRLK